MIAWGKAMVQAWASLISAENMHHLGVI